MQTQHHTPVKLLTDSRFPVRERLLRRLATGELLSGIAFAHVRAFPRVLVRRRPAPNTNVSPAVFGVAYAALGLLESDPDATETARSLRTRLDSVRQRAYALADHPVPHERVDERLALKTRAHDLMRAATTAAIVAVGGRAMTLGNRAQRLAREGMFLLIQGQTAEVRRAQLEALRTSAPSRTGSRPVASD